MLRKLASVWALQGLDGLWIAMTFTIHTLRVIVEVIHYMLHLQCAQYITYNLCIYIYVYIYKYVYELCFGLSSNAISTRRIHLEATWLHTR